MLEISAIVPSSRIAAIATFALNSALCFFLVFVTVTPWLNASLGARLYLSQLSNFRGPPHTSTYVSNAQGILSNQSLLLNTTTIGAEFEGSWNPVDYLQIDGSATIQDPHVTNASTFNTISAQSVVGAVITRTPKQTFTVSPTYLFSGPGYNAQLFTTVYYVSQRFQDFTNTSTLPAYVTFDAGLDVQLKKGWDLELLGTNLNNSAGLTEGNARAPVGNAISVADATTGRPLFGRTLTFSALYKF